MSVSRIIIATVMVQQELEAGEAAKEPWSWGIHGTCTLLVRSRDCSVGTTGLNPDPEVGIRGLLF